MNSSNKTWWLIGCAAMALGAGCTSAPDDADDDLPDVSADKADGDGINVLQTVQIKDVGSLHATGDAFKYTGHPRYIGARIKATADSLLKIGSEIDNEEHPTIVIADANLKVLVKEVGATIAGGPGTSYAGTTFKIPTSGTYWVLFGEQNRGAFTLHTSHSLTVAAGSACSHASDCTSNVCSGGLCGQASTTHACAIDADCTTGKCSTIGYACEPDAVGEACTSASDCTSDLCTSDVCSCVKSGDAPPNPNDANQCCGGNPIEYRSDGSAYCL